MTHEKPNGSANQQFYFDGNIFKSKAHGTVLDNAHGKYEEKVGITIILTRRWGQILWPFSSSCGGLQALAEVFFCCFFGNLFVLIYYFGSNFGHLLDTFGWPTALALLLFIGFKQW